MAKRGYKLQEFVAHPANVNCLSIGKKTSRLLITGGDDHKVNLWAIGKPTPLMSLCGHTSPVESVAFNPGEVLVVAGSSAGVIKLWDLDEAKMVRALTGHRSNSTAVDFHPFGEFLASGSMDTNLKIWDIRKKGCIQTYKGHTRGINTIRFTPDGRWVVSGGLDNVVKVWDLTAGKILHEFKFHEGHIRTLDFHPLEFLLATGSADGTVKFWDLETFELIGSSRPESSGVRAITFHPDGRTLFCGLDDNLQVYSWEPVICHDSVDMGWSTLGDLCINEGKLLGCSYYSNSVGVWVSDVSLIEPYGAGLSDKHKYTEKIFTSSRSQSSERPGNDTGPHSIVRSTSLDCETKEIKNIYIDSSGAILTAAQKVVAESARKEVDKSFAVPGIVLLKGNTGENSSELGGEPITFSRTKPGMLLRPAHLRKTLTEFDDTKRPPAVLSRTPSRGKRGSDSEKEQDFQSGFTVKGRGRKPCDEEHSSIKSITNKFEKALSSEPPSNEINCLLSKPPHAPRTLDAKIRETVRSASADSGFMCKKKGAGYLSDQEIRDEFISEDGTRKPCDEKFMNIKNSKSKFTRSPSPQATDDVRARVASLNRSSESNSVKVVGGVAVVSGRTRSLVKRFERREANSGNEEKLASVTVSQSPNVTAVESDVLAPQSGNAVPTTVIPVMPVLIDRATDVIERKKYTGIGANPFAVSTNQPTNVIANESQVPPLQLANTVPRQAVSATVVQVTDTGNNERFSGIGDKTVILTTDQPTNVMTDESKVSPPKPRNTVPSQVKPVRRNMRKYERFNGTGDKMLPEEINQPTNVIMDEPRVMPPRPVDNTPTRVLLVTDVPNDKKEEPEISGRGSEAEITENFMQTHDAFLSALQSRLMKLQIVRRFWERNDLEGAIGALKKLPDHSVQADVIGVLMVKTKILTLDLFYFLLPILTDLLRSKTERPANVSLEMLLKLVALFGTVIHSTVSAPRVVGVDLHAEQRLQLYNECFVGLKNIKKILPELTRRGGLNGRKAQELNLVLQGPY